MPKEPPENRIDLHSTNSLDWTKVPRDRRSLSVKTYELMLGQPMEEVLTLMYIKYRSMPRVAKAMHLEDRTIRRWMIQLGLRICYRCSKKTGKLFSEIFRCPQCVRYLCKECMLGEPEMHYLREHVI